VVFIIIFVFPDFMINILVTGSKGQLGTEISTIAENYPDLQFTFTDIEELDITSLQEIERFFENKHFDALINCAAYTAVDKAEEEVEKAFLLNASAIDNLVSVATYHQCYPIHISTDYVFSGKHFTPYREEDETDPVSVYGESKLEGERAFLRGTDTGLIIRTSWLYSSFGKNFVRTILERGKEKKHLRVVSDQVGSPTYAGDLANTILTILPKAMKAKKSGIYHFSDEGVCSWYDLALEAIKYSGIECEVEAVGSEEFPVVASRPFYSVLDKRKIKKEFGITIPHWRDSLRECVRRLV